MPPTEPLLSFFRALADASRLRVVGLLAHRPHSVEELATVLDLRPSTVSHHLHKLATAGLVRSSTRGHYHVYALDLDALHEQAKRLSTDESLKRLVPEHGSTDRYDDKVLATFLDERGRLAKLPMKRKKLEVVLRHALRLFEDEGPWDEREVNRRLETLSDDVASLRRGLIDHRMMTREPGGKKYRRILGDQEGQARPQGGAP